MTGPRKLRDDAPFNRHLEAFLEMMVVERGASAAVLAELDAWLEHELERVLGQVVQNGDLNQYAAAVAARRADPYSVTDKILEQAGWSDAQR